MVWECFSLGRSIQALKQAEESLNASLTPLMDTQWRMDQRLDNPVEHMGVSRNRGTPKSSILIGFSIINHPFWGTGVPLFSQTPI